MSGRHAQRIPSGSVSVCVVRLSSTVLSTRPPSDTCLSLPDLESEVAVQTAKTAEPVHSAAAPVASEEPALRAKVRELDGQVELLRAELVAAEDRARAAEAAAAASARAAAEAKAAAVAAEAAAATAAAASVPVATPAAADDAPATPQSKPAPATETEAVGTPAAARVSATPPSRVVLVTPARKSSGLALGEEVIARARQLERKMQHLRQMVSG